MSRLARKGDAILNSGTEEPWVALVGPEIQENLSLRYLAACLARAGFGSEILAFNGERDFSRVVRAIVGARTRPLAVGLSLAFQWRATDFLAVAMALRQQGFAGHITAGGHYATFAAEELLRNFSEIDSLCRFEAEETIVKLARALAAGASLCTVAGLAIRDGDKVSYTAPRSLPDLARLPWPDAALHEYALALMSPSARQPAEAVRK